MTCGEFDCDGGASHGAGGGATVVTGGATVAMRGAAVALGGGAVIDLHPVKAPVHVEFCKCESDRIPGC